MLHAQSSRCLTNRATTSKGCKSPIARRISSPTSGSRQFVNLVVVRAEPEKVEAPPASSPSKEPEADEIPKLNTWTYGKTISDKDLPAWYVGFMLLPFIALLTLPFLLSPPPATYL
eukprot:gene15911-22045_t